MQIELPEELDRVDQVVQRLARTARNTGLDAAGALLEALRDALAARHAQLLGRD